jgi:hypothetical protein
LKKQSHSNEPASQTANSPQEPDLKNQTHSANGMMQKQT